ncbi:MAG: tetratricopeptide repeat protein [Dehalococcoidia bacterium]|nr:tetratricopeptide repeat protein [Dehalococcoidia bacterium]
MIQDKESLERLIRQASKQAITLALEGRWREAADANKVILESFPNDVDTLNRLGRALIELGDYIEARAAYTRAKEIEPYNAIAEKNLKRLELFDGSQEGGKHEGSTKLDPNTFIEEMGKAGVLRLQRVGPKELLIRMVAGDKVVLVAIDGTLQVKNEAEEYLGEVEPRHGQRLIRLMAGGNRYSASVTSSSEESLSIIIRETYQHPSQAGQLSFPLKGTSGGARYSSGDRVPYRYTEYEEGLADEGGYGLLSDDEEIETDLLEENEEEEDSQP